jgi:hypothetical protein
MLMFYFCPNWGISVLNWNILFEAHANKIILIYVESTSGLSIIDGPLDFL